MKTKLNLNKEFIDSLNKIKSKNITYIWRKIYEKIKNFELTEAQKSILEDWLEFKLNEINNSFNEDMIVDVFYWNKKLREFLSQDED